MGGQGWPPIKLISKCQVSGEGASGDKSLGVQGLQMCGVSGEKIQH